MSSGRSTVGSQNKAAKPTISSTRNAAQPLTPKLAANSTTTKRAPSPKRPFVRTPTNTSGTRSPSPTKNATPIQSSGGDTTTPRSTVRSTVRGGSTVSTPTSAGPNTPGSLRAKSPPVRPHLATAYTTPSVRGAQNGTPTPFVRKAGNTGEVARSSPLTRVVPGDAPQQGIDAIMNDKSPLFFHASDARAAQPAARPPPPKKMPTFVYANGREEERLVSQAGREMSTIAAPIEGQVSTAGSSLGLMPSRTLSPPLISPTLSATSSTKSPLFPPQDHSILFAGPTTPSAVTGTVHSAPTSANLNVPRMRTQEPSNRMPLSTPSPIAGLGLVAERKTSAGSVSPSRHGKSASVSVAPPESPSVRKRSATWAEKRQSLEKKAPVVHFPAASPNLSKDDPSSMPNSPLIGSDLPQSPTREKAAPDFAAEARRERKVLDLEISNSSLLAINRSLEREVKKQKAELKRFRRLSRAGHFALPATKNAESDDLPEIDGSATRPSSPFEEDVSDMLSSSESDGDDGDTTSSSSQRDATLRAKDEERIRRDLRKHRELILDTARMNRSLQRCLTWTEDLIKDGKKALDHHIRSEEVRLGGRILSADDDDMEDETLGSAEATRPSTAAGTLVTDGADEVGKDEEAQAEDMSGVEAFLGLGPWRHNQENFQHNNEVAQNAGLGQDSPLTDRDSGIEIQKIRKCSRSPVPRTEAAATVLRGSLGETY